MTVMFFFFSDWYAYAFVGQGPKDMTVMSMIRSLNYRKATAEWWLVLIGSFLRLSTAGVVPVPAINSQKAMLVASGP